jgi:Dipeptidyl aminopeptidases/acylaminoacyl-peptidases
MAGIILCTSSNYAQTFSGNIDLGGQELKLIFMLNFQKNTGTLDVPAQYAFWMDLSSLVRSNDNIKISIDGIRASFDGKIFGNVDSISGTFHQYGMNFPLTLNPDENYQPPKRSQLLEPPYPYYTEDITFVNEKAGIKLAGTITAPDTKGKYPAVVFITGSGPQDRDELIVGHKPFRVIADYLARHGIASLRFDDRGVAKSEGDFASATSLDFASDAAAGVKALATYPFIDTKKLGVIGHSEGGLIVPIAASLSDQIKFIISLAGTGVDGRKQMHEEITLVAVAEGKSPEDAQTLWNLYEACFTAILANPDLAAKQVDSTYNAFFKDFTPAEKERLLKYPQFHKSQFMQLTSKWWIKFLTLDPAPYYEKLKVPALGIWGGKDLEVPPWVHVPPIITALEKAGVYYRLEILASINHMFQKSSTGALHEFYQNEITVEPEIMESVVRFIKGL